MKVKELIERLSSLENQDTNAVSAIRQLAADVFLACHDAMRDAFDAEDCRQRLRERRFSKAAEDDRFVNALVCKYQSKYDSNMSIWENIDGAIDRFIKVEEWAHLFIPDLTSD